MSDVKPKPRQYRSPKRAAQAEATRESVLSSAHQLFLSQGWTKTTIAAIAAKAGVSNETIYAVFGNKRALLQELIARTVRGGEPDTPLTSQRVPRLIAAEPDQRRQIDLFSQDIAKVLEGVAPLMDVARSAAGSDAAMADLYARLHGGRRKNLEWFAQVLARNGPLKGGMATAEAASIIWRLASPDLFILIRYVEGASRPAYSEWLADSLKQLILEPGA
jgi:AcrR family transcriptional regulator